MVGCPHGSVELRVLEEVTPKSWERREAEETVERTVKLVESALSRLLEHRYNEYILDVRVEGSFAKDTWLSGDVDFDLFILFRRSYCSKSLLAETVEKLQALLEREGLTVEKRYAEHPYLRVKVGRYWAEVVPACAISPGEKPLTAVDRTPLHTEYIKSRLGAVERGEVRLLKSFLKGIGVYGAEIAVEGFSGYLAELLIVEYQCFRRLLEEAASKWRPPVVIDVEGHYTSRRQVLEVFGRDKPLIVVDPVDPSRNVAAAVSLRSFAKFVLAARLYLSQPSTRYFSITPPSRSLALGEAIAAANGRAGRIVVIVLEPEAREPPETLWGVGKRVAKLARSLLERWGFNVVSWSTTACSEERILIAVEVAERILPPYELLRGPPAWMGEHAARFYSKYIGDNMVYGPWVGDDGRLYVLRPRRYRDAIVLLRDREAEWKPGSARSYRTWIGSLPSLNLELRECERTWLRNFVVLKLEDWETKSGSTLATS